MLYQFMIRSRATMELREEQLVRQRMENNYAMTQLERHNERIECDLLELRQLLRQCVDVESQEQLEEQAI